MLQNNVCRPKSRTLKSIFASWMSSSFMQKKVILSIGYIWSITRCIYRDALQLKLTIWPCHLFRVLCCYSVAKAKIWRHDLLQLRIPCERFIRYKDHVGIYICVCIPLFYLLLFLLSYVLEVYAFEAGLTSSYYSSHFPQLLNVEDGTCHCTHSLTRFYHR